MEFCSGGDLSGFIKSKRTIPEKYAKKFLQQIGSIHYLIYDNWFNLYINIDFYYFNLIKKACALKYLHMAGITHMDLKPQNILLTSLNNPSCKIADFGFALYLGNRSATALKGSPLYMAPEILKSKAYDSRVDLWSVGVIFHEVLFGYAPFLSNTFEELELKILDDAPIKLPAHIRLSEECEDLLKGLLQRNPDDRISFQKFFSHPFIDLDHMPSDSSLHKAVWKLIFL